MNQLDLTTIKNFCSVKDNAKRMKKQITGWKNIFAKYTLNKEILSKLHKDLLKCNNTTKTNKPVTPENNINT